MTCPVVIKVTVPSGPAVVRVATPGPPGSAGPPASLSDSTPQTLGTAAAGTSSTGSRSDHRHAMPNAAGVGADATGTAAAAVAAHEAAADPHPTYTTAAEAAAAAPVQSVAGRTGAVMIGVADVSGAVSSNDARLSDARTPTTHNQAWSTIISTPTTLSGYGITDTQATVLATPLTGYTSNAGTISATDSVLQAIQKLNGNIVSNSGIPGGSNTHIQFNDNGTFGGDADLTYNKTTNLLTTKGDILLDDGGSFSTTLQMVTPTANRIISLPNATGTVALVGGSSGQITYNLNGANAGLNTLTADSSGNLTLSARLTNTFNSVAGVSAKLFSGTWFTGGTATTTKPHFLIEPAGTTSNTWSVGGTGFGVNAPSGFAGNLLDLQVGGLRHFRIASTGSGSYAEITVQAGFTNEGLSIAASNSQAKTKLSFSDGLFLSSGAGTCDVVIRSDDLPDTFAQRRGTNAQTSRIYNTYTSATNFERAKIEWASNTLRIGTEKGSAGGTARDMELQTDGTTRITVKASGAIIYSGLPTSNPNVAGQLWNDGGTLKISA